MIGFSRDGHLPRPKFGYHKMGIIYTAEKKGVHGLRLLGTCFKFSYRKNGQGSRQLSVAISRNIEQGLAEIHTMREPAPPVIPTREKIVTKL
jgi:hypothetical protein